MKAIMVMFDSLNRHMLPPYGCEWVRAPNFERLARHGVTFENSYVGSMPCMPARREMHTGRYNFLHRSWGPLEPFDDSMPQILGESGIYTHLASDHGHYWEDGGCTYHTRYTTWEISRGHEGDPWKGQIADPEIPESVGRHSGRMWRQDWVNRQHMQREEDQPQAKTFAQGLEFIETNHDQDNWFLHIETFDPHEPFYTQAQYKALYPHHYDGPHFDWPPYGPAHETPAQVQHARYEYAASLSMCDAWLGKVLDLMDKHHLWDDTMLIVNTDHGFLLGEHDWWAKCVQPFYGEVAHSPLFIWDPRCGCQHERRTALVQTIDLPATLLEFFGVPLPVDMQGAPLRETIATDKPVRHAALFGLHGGHVNVTDGRYVYMRAPATPENCPLHNYTLMPTHMRARFSVDELKHAELADPFSFTKGCRTIRVPARRWPGSHPFQTLLFDLRTDPKQENPIQDADIEARMIQQLVRLMEENDAPREQFTRLGLSH
ncbi:MAG: sulfatase [Anaerolineae bacterium]|nr:sulfatase [Anaerolineae bacterium]